LRQKAVDEHWDEQARALAEKRASEDKKPGKARVGSGPKVRVTKQEIETIKKEFGLQRLNYMSAINSRYNRISGSEDQVNLIDGLKCVRCKEVMI
jgi:hypothetical protein